MRMGSPPGWSLEPGSQLSLRHNRPSARTLFFAITGTGSAALVTSVSALSVGEDEFARWVALLGGTAILAIAAAITLLCARRVSDTWDRLAWGGAGVSLILTAWGSGLRSSVTLAGEEFFTPGIAEGVYIGGTALFIAILVGWPLTKRRFMNLTPVVLESAVVSAAIAVTFWLTMGMSIVEGAIETGSLEPTQMRQFLALLMVMTAAAVFSFASAVNLRTIGPVLPWVMLSLAMLMVVAGDAVWLWNVSRSGWRPGSLGDFIHISGHVLVAVSASLALDNDRERVSRPAA